MRGIISYGGYVPYHRLQRAAIAAVVGGPAGKGARSVASYDEDTTTMGVEAARTCLRAASAAVQPSALYFASAEPAYAEKTNAATVHAALGLDTAVGAFDFCGAPRSAIGALRAGLEGSSRALVVTAGIRTGLASGPDESAGGDGAAALLVGEGAGSPVLAEYLAGAGATEEFVDRWRAPGEDRTHQWEERFGESRYLPLGEQAWKSALEQAGLGAEDVARAVVTGTHARAVRGLARTLGLGSGVVADDLSSTVGNTGAAHPGLVLASVLDTAGPGEVIALVSLDGGADVLLFRTTEAIAGFRADRPVQAQIEAGDDTLAYAKFLSWRGQLRVQPPNRPEPARYSASAAARNEDWKYSFVGSRDRSSGALHLPPQRVSWKDGAVDEMDPAPMADVAATIVTFTVDRLAYSPSPPIVFAVVDFDGGGRLPVELTDVDAAEVAIGDRVEMTFRRIATADGLHNYFWKARPVRTGA